MGAPQSRPEHELPPDMDERLLNVFLFGDSITETSFDTEGGASPDHATGMVLRKRWKKKANVVNFGKGGQTTRSLKGYFEDEILHFCAPDLGFEYLTPPRLITIWLGANDGSLPDSPAHVPIDEYECNLHEYVDKIFEEKGWHRTKVLLMTCPPVDRDPNDGNIKIPPTLDPHEGEGYIDWRSRRLYAERVMKVAKSYDDDRVQGLDVWTLFVKSALKDLDMEWDEEKLPGSCLRGAPRFPGSGVHKKGYLSDGLHLGDKVGLKHFCFGHG